MHTPRVSVVMNCRNGAEFLHEALDSLLMQTVCDWELIAWDDESIDDTCTILRSYDDERFRTFAAPRGTSLSGVRQAAIKECRGDWIAFLDQDDVWLPHKLARQLEVADRYPDAAIVYGRALAFHDGGSYRDYDHRHAWSPLPEGNIFKALFEDSCFICMSSVMIRSVALRSVLPVPEVIRLTPDYYFYLSLSRQQSAYAVQEPVCLYRRHRNNVSRHRWVEMHEECLQLITRFGQHISPALQSRRLAVHQSLIAFGLLFTPGKAGAGLRHLLRHGSVSYFLSRPFVRAGRLMRQVLVRPVWQHEQLDGKSMSVREYSPEKVKCMPVKVSLVGTGISSGTFAAAQGALLLLVGNHRGGYICNANVYSTMLARSSSRLRRSLAHASMVIADGMPIVWLLQAFGQPAERVHGDDLLFACCAAFPHWRHFFLGGRGGQDRTVLAALKQRYPDLCIVGSHATPQRPLSSSMTEVILNEIEKAKTDIVWVGMGTPNQDYWMSDVSNRTAAVMVGVGSAFDLLSGHSRPTPQWMKKAGLQWLSRLIQEPRRLARRYLYYNTIFLGVSAQEIFRLTCRNLLLMARPARRKSGEL